MTDPVRLTGDPAASINKPADQGRALIFAGLLAALAGMVDAIGYLHLGGLFVSFMSGNSTQLAAAIGQGDLPTLQDAVGKCLAPAAVFVTNAWVVVRYVQSRTRLKQSAVR